MLAAGVIGGWGGWLLVTAVGLAATLLESLIGATLQPRLALAQQRAGERHSDPAGGPAGHGHRRLRG